MKLTDCQPCAQTKVQFYAAPNGSCEVCGSPVYVSASGMHLWSCDCHKAPRILEGMRQGNMIGVMSWTMG